MVSIAAFGIAVVPEVNINNQTSPPCSGTWMAGSVGGLVDDPGVEFGRTCDRLRPLADRRRGRITRLGDPEQEQDRLHEVLAVAG